MGSDIGFGGVTLAAALTDMGKPGEKRRPRGRLQQSCRREMLLARVVAVDVVRKCRLWNFWKDERTAGLW